jgi:hypothetical protein
MPAEKENGYRKERKVLRKERKVLTVYESFAPFANRFCALCG